jgi:hypothetical protein
MRTFALHIPFGIRPLKQFHMMDFLLKRAFHHANTFTGLGYLLIQLYFSIIRLIVKYATLIIAFILKPFSKFLAAKFLRSLILIDNFFQNHKRGLLPFHSVPLPIKTTDNPPTTISTILNKQH